MLLPYFHLVDLYFLLLMIAFMNKLHFLHWFEMLLLLYLIYNVSLCVFHLLLDFLFPLLVFYYYSKLYAFNCSFMTFMYWLNYYSFIICFYFWKTDNHSILLSFPSDFSLLLFYMNFRISLFILLGVSMVLNLPSRGHELSSCFCLILCPAGEF